MRMSCESSRSYDVVIMPGLLDSSSRTLAGCVGERPALLVVDRNVDALYGEQLRACVAELPGPAKLHVAEMTEQAKDVTAVLEICRAAQRMGLRRRDQLVAVAASLIRRGMPYICIPTTLVGQVDAGIGLKGGVNFGGAKNYLGCFTPPSRVLIDPEFLRTLPVRELRAGLAEMIKIALVLDDTLFDSLRAVGPQLLRSGFTAPAGAGAELIERSVALMLVELSLDCFEQGTLERLVDFGHTFSGRLEEVSRYELRHGEAVALDIALACAIGVELGLFSEDGLAEVLCTLAVLGLPTYTPMCTLDVVLEAMSATVAHRDGALNLVVPTAVGKATVVRDVADVPPRTIQRALARLQAA